MLGIAVFHTCPAKQCRCVESLITLKPTLQPLPDGSMSKLWPLLLLILLACACPGLGLDRSKRSVRFDVPRRPPPSLLSRSSATTGSNAEGGSLPPPPAGLGAHHRMRSMPDPFLRDLSLEVPRITRAHSEDLSRAGAHRIHCRVHGKHVVHSASSGSQDHGACCSSMWRPLLHQLKLVGHVKDWFDCENLSGP